MPQSAFSTPDIQQISGKHSAITKGEFLVSAFSPVFVGSGETLVKDLDFISQDGNTFLLDLEKLFREQIGDIDKLERAISTSKVFNYIVDNKLKAHNFNKQKIRGKCSGAELYEIVTDGMGRPMLPGSSLKGSLRTALFAHYFEQNKSMQRGGMYKNSISNRGKSKKPQSASQDLQKLLLSPQAPNQGLMPNYDLGRVIRISDALFKPDNLCVYNVAVVNQVRGGYMWKNLGLPPSHPESNTERLAGASQISVAGVDSSGEFPPAVSISISIDDNARKAIGWKEKIDFRFIAHVCNTLSLRILEKEIGYFEDAESVIPGLGDVLDELNDIKDEIEIIQKENKKNEKVCWMQRMGWGSGWLSMTGAHATLENGFLKELRSVYTKLGRDGMPFPKSRKVVLDNAGKPSSVMGWVLVEQQ